MKSLWQQFNALFAAHENVRNSTNGPSPQLMELEPRILYSVSPVGVESFQPDAGLQTDALLVDSSINPVVADVSSSERSDLVDEILGKDPSRIEVDLDRLIELASELSSEPEQVDDSDDTYYAEATYSDSNWRARNQSNVELIFVDQDVSQYEQLIGQIVDSADASRDFQVFVLQDTSDGAEQIANIMAGHSEVASLHLISHGSAGQFNLGSSWLSNATLDQFAESIGDWSKGMRAGADVLIYGCELAATDQGVELIQSIRQITGRDVAASDDMTGHSELGGDWILEVHSGDVETRSLFDQAVFSSAGQEVWVGILPGTPPTEVNNLGLVLNEGDVSGISNAELSFIDAEDPPASISFTITGGLSNGQLELTTAPLVPISSFTQADIDGGLLVYRHDGSESLTDIFNFTVDDGQGNSVYGQEFLINVAPVNDSNPVITSSSNVNIDENERIVQTLTATDSDSPGQSISFSLTGVGADDAIFTVNESNQLVFVESPNFESPQDTGTNNIYNIQILADDGNGGTSTQNIAVTVDNVLEGAIVVVDTTDDYSTIDARYGNTSSIAALLSDKGSDNLISLREAIDAANNSFNFGGRPDEIRFDIPDSDLRHFYYRDDGVAGSLSLVVATTLDDSLITDFDVDYPYVAHSWFSIELDSSLPRLDITDEVIIDGYSQSGSRANTLNIGNNASLRIELTTDGGGNRGLSVLNGGDDSIIRGLAINNFGGSGILTEPGANDVTIQGNFLGTDITGSYGIANGDAGVHLRSSDNLVGGSNLEDRNIISGNASRGVVTFTFGPIAFDNVIQNNYIGTDATGLVAIANNNAGIQVYQQNGIKILDNVISGNTGDGVWQRAGSNNTNTVALGNMIGVGADGTTALGNSGAGVRIESAGNNSTIGGVNPGEANTIAHNTESGIEVLNGTRRHTLRGNSIHSNGGLGIDLDDNGVTLNDGNDFDLGTNRLQNFPVISSVFTNANDAVSISGTINSESVTDITLDFYFSLTGDPSSHGEAEFYLGSILVTTDFFGNASFDNVVFSANVPQGAQVTATATKTVPSMLRSTSEFGQNVAAVANSTPAITSDGGGDTAFINVAENSSGVTTVIATDAETPLQSIQYSIVGGVDAANFTIDNNTGALNFVLAPDFEAPTDFGADNVYEVQVQATDELGSNDKQFIVVAVDPIDEEAPTVVNNLGISLSAGSFSGIDNTELRFDDSEQLPTNVTYTVTGGLSNGQLELTTAPLTPILSFTQDDIDSGRLVYRHDGTNTTSDTFNFDVDDGQGNAATAQTFSIIVNPVDSTPPAVVNNTGITLDEGTTSGIDNSELRFDDTEQLPINVTYTVTGGLANGQLELTTSPLTPILSFNQNDIDSGRLVYRHNGSETTSDSFTFDVDDGQGNALTSQIFSIIVNPVDDTLPTVINNTGMTLNEGGLSGIDNSELRVDDSEQPPTGVTFTVNGGLINGQLELTTSPSTPILSFTQDDIDGGRLVYRHNGSETTSDSFSFDVDDGQGNSVTAQVFSIAIVPVPDGNPVFTSAANQTIDENDTVVHTLTAVDGDLPPQPISFAIRGTGPDDSLFTLNASDELVFINPPDFENPEDSDFDNLYLVEIEADDGQGGVSVQVVTVTVNDVNESPTANDDLFAMDNPNSLVITESELLLNDSDPENATLVITVVNPPDSGTLIINPDNTLTYRPDPGTTGLDSFTYQISDGINAPDAATVFVRPMIVAPPVTPPTTVDTTDVDDTVDESDSETEVVSTPDNEKPSAETIQRIGPANTASDIFREIVKRESNDEALAPYEFSSKEDAVLSSFRVDISRNNQGYKLSSIDIEALASEWENEQKFPEEWYSNYVTNDFLGALDGIREEVASEDMYYSGIVSSTIAVTSSLSVGYVIWMIRGGVLMSSILSSLPAWKMIDPLPILADGSDEEDQDDESLESMVSKSNQDAEFAAI